jgi:hypothetical protein
MLTLVQVNYGINPIGLLGLMYLLLGAAYFILMIVLLVPRARRLARSAVILDFIQILFVAIVLFFSGLILIFQGWRLTPILMFGQFLLLILIIYFCIKDIVVNAADRNR